MSTRHIQEFPNQKRSDHPPRFSVHFFTNIGSEPSAKAASTSAPQESGLIDSVTKEYQRIFSDDIHESLSAKTYRISGLEATMQHPMSFTVVLTGKQQKVDDKPLPDEIIGATTFVCNKSTILICYLFVTDQVYGKKFGAGKTNKLFRGNGLCRFMLQSAIMAHTICQEDMSVAPHVHLQVRSDSPAFNQLLSLGFGFVSTYQHPPEMDVPFWLNGHEHLFSNHGMYECLQLCQQLLSFAMLTIIFFLL